MALSWPTMDTAAALPPTSQILYVLSTRDKRLNYRLSTWYRPWLLLGSMIAFLNTTPREVTLSNLINSTLQSDNPYLDSRVLLLDTYCKCYSYSVATI